MLNKLHVCIHKSQGHWYGVGLFAYQSFILNIHHLATSCRPNPAARLPTSILQRYIAKESVVSDKKNIFSWSVTEGKSPKLSMGTSSSFCGSLCYWDIYI